MYKFKINEIILKNKQKIKPKKINIIIGPNNTGKSRFLKEIANEVSYVREENYLIDNIEMKLPKNYEELRKGYRIDEKIITDVANNKRLLIYNNYNNQNEYPYLQDDRYYESIIDGSNKDFLRDFGGMFLNYLGTENRLIMLKEKDPANRAYGQTNFLVTLHNSMISKGISYLSMVSKETSRLFRKRNRIRSFNANWNFGN